MAKRMRGVLLAVVGLLLPAAAHAGICDAHYPFDGSLVDAGDNGYHGELLDKRSQPTVGAGFVPGLAGQALRVSGDKFVRTPLNLQTDDCPKVTITAWVYFETFDAGPQTLVSTGYGMGPRLDRSGYRLSALGASNSIGDGNSVRSGVWMFVAGTWDYETGVHRLYWNNRYIEEPLGTNKRPPQEHFWIGANGYLGSVFYIANNVRIDDVRVYGRVLSPLEIAIAQREHAQRVVAPAAVDMTQKAFTTGSVCEAHYPLDGDLRDVSGNRYHGQTINLESATSPGTNEFVPGRFGQAIRLDGTAAMIAPFDLHWNLCPRVTVTAWVYFEDEPGGERTIISTGFGSGPRLSAVSRSLKASGGINSILQKNVFEQGVWTFVVGIWDYPAGVYRIVTESGSLEEPLGDYARSPQQELWLGIHAYNQSLVWPATAVRIDDVRVYGRVLDTDELALVRTEAPVGRYGLPGIVAEADSPGVFTGGVGAVSGLGGADALGDRGILPAPDVAASDEPSAPISIPDVEESVLAARDRAAGVADPELTPPENLPGELPTDSEEWQEAALREYQRQQNEEFENRFGPRNRTQVVVANNRSLAFGAREQTIITGPGDPPRSGVDIESWMSGGSLREILRLKNTNSYIAIDADGTVAIQGPTNGRHVDLVADVDGIVARGRPIDLVAEGDNRYLIVSGTELVSKNMTATGALGWAESQLRLRAQITAFAFLGGDAWIGVSTRGVTTGGMSANHYGVALRQKATEMVQAGERIEDISAAWSEQDDGAITGTWAIATDRQIYYRNDIDCDNHEAFGANVESDLDRTFTCHVPVPPCPSSRPIWSFDDMESPANRNVWHVNVLVTIGVADYDGEEKERFDCWLERSLSRAEALYDRTPAMRLHLNTRRATAIDGQSLSQMNFASEGDYRRFMEEHFDIVASTDTSGYFQVVVTDELKIGDKDIGGRATFPHAVEPFSRKYGIALEPSERDDTILAHEFGHYLGLKHTFEPYGITTNNCNRDYDANWLRMEERYCRSCLSGMDLVNDTCDGQYNVMDYCENPNPPQQVYVNDCQQRRASNQKERYTDNAGRTLYGRMKGDL